MDALIQRKKLRIMSRKDKFLKISFEDCKVRITVRRAFPKKKNTDSSDDENCIDTNAILKNCGIVADTVFSEENKKAQTAIDIRDLRNRLKQLDTSNLSWKHLWNWRLDRNNANKKRSKLIKHPGIRQLFYCIRRHRFLILFIRYTVDESKYAEINGNKDVSSKILCSRQISVNKTTNRSDDLLKKKNIGIKPAKKTCVPSQQHTIQKSVKKILTSRPLSRNQANISAKKSCISPSPKQHIKKLSVDEAFDIYCKKNGLIAKTSQTCKSKLSQAKICNKNMNLKENVKRQIKVRRPMSM